MGMQVSEARGDLGRCGAFTAPRIIDMGGMKGMLAFAGWAAGEQERETDSGYEKTYTQDGRLVHEEWDSEQKTANTPPCWASGSQSS